MKAFYTYNVALYHIAKEKYYQHLDPNIRGEEVQ